MPWPVRCTNASARPASAEHVARHRVHLLRGYTGPHRIDGGPLGTLQHRVPPCHFGVRLPDAVGAGRVGVVAGFVRPADVDDDDVAGPQLTVRALVVRVGAVRAGPDDDERHFRMPLGHNRFGDVRGDVSLGAARYQELRHPGVHPVDGRARLAQRVDLGGVLDHPQSPQHVWWPAPAPRPARRPAAADAARASSR